MTLTKTQIDRLVDALPNAIPGYQPTGFTRFGDWRETPMSVASVPTEDVRRALYLAAGLNADGSEKAKVRDALLRRRLREARNEYEAATLADMECDGCPNEGQTGARRHAGLDGWLKALWAAKDLPPDPVEEAFERWRATYLNYERGLSKKEWEERSEAFADLCDAILAAAKEEPDAK